MEVKCRYTEIYSINGINLPYNESEKELIVDSIKGLRAVLTTHPNSYAFEGDRSLAVAGMMKRGFLNLEPRSDEFKQHIANEVDEIQTRRANKFGAGTFLVVIGEEIIPSFSPFSFEGKAEDIEDFRDFLVCFDGSDGADKEEIRSRFHSKTTALLNSIAVIMGSVVGIKKVKNFVIFLREDDKPIYSYTVSGSAQVYTSKPVSDDTLPLIESLYLQLAEDKTLQRVQRLLRSSFETGDDRLRSFLDVWMAFEIFINKIFVFYQNRFLNSLFKEGHTELQKKCIERIKEVMKGKYQLIDKFAEISFLLTPDTTGEDLEIIQKANKIFVSYENSFLISLFEERRTEVQKKYLDRIKEVMNGKYRLVDNFAAVSFELSPDTADEDLKFVHKAKKIRDLISRGQSVEEDTLPVNEIQSLVGKYLHLHINSNLRVKNC